MNAVTLNNMGCITKEDMEAFAARVLNELAPDWLMKWTDCSGGICLKNSREIFIPERMIGEYPWMAKEYILHEAAHIFTDDDQHGGAFYKVYIGLLWQFMIAVSPSPAG